MFKENVRLGLKRSVNFQSYEESVEKEILFKDSEDRERIIDKIYDNIRKDLDKQIKKDRGE